jgi:hypothetical protein
MKIMYAESGCRSNVLGSSTPGGASRANARIWG